MATPSPQSNPDQPRLETGEVIITTSRKHWINLAPVILSTAILVLLFFFGTIYYDTHMDNIHKYVPAAYIAIFSFFFWILVVGILLLSIWIYRQNRLVLTNHHLMEYTRRGLFDHTVAQFSLIKLQDVSARQRGFLANVLGYGNIELETAGESENFLFQQLPQAQALANQIMQAHERLESGSEREHRSV